MNHKFTTSFWVVAFYFGLLQILWAQNLPTPNPQFAALPQTLYPSQILHNQSPFIFSIKSLAV
jgi:hypothetical protein